MCILSFVKGRIIFANLFFTVVFFFKIRFYVFDSFETTSNTWVRFIRMPCDSTAVLEK